MLVVLAIAALAEPVNPFDEADEAELFRLDEDLVTVASRYAETTREAPSIVTVFSADDLREHGFRTLSDALRTLPGIYVWKSPEGRELATFRGVVAADNDKFLLLVDGVPWYDGVYTHAFIDEYLPLAAVRQIEVTQGPGSAIYGTNAFSGVINVVTFSGSDVEGGRLRVVGGSAGRIDATGTAGGTARVAGREGSAVAFIRVFSQDGVGVDANPDGQPNALGEDPKRGVMAGVRLELDGLAVQLHHVDWRHTYLLQQSVDDPYTALGTDLDTAGIRYHDTYFDAVYRIPLGSSYSVAPHVWFQRHDDPGDYWYSRGVTDELQLDNVLIATEKDTARYGASVDADLRPGIDHHTVAGAGVEVTRAIELQDIKFDLENPGGAWTRYGIDPAGGAQSLCDVYGYAQHTWVAVPGVEVVGGVRGDQRLKCGQADPGATPFNLSPRIALLLVPNDRVTAKLLVGTAFRDPTVRELLVEPSDVNEDGVWDFTSGNRNLLSERIATVDAEVRAKLSSGFDLRADVFASRLSGEINKVDTPQGSLYDNIGPSLDTAGFEAGAEAERGPFRLKLAYAFLDARYRNSSSGDGDDSFAGLRQYEAPPHQVRGDLRVAPSERVVGTVMFEGSSARPRAEWASGAANGKPYALVHAAMRIRDLGPDGRAEIGVGVRNLGKRYDTGVFRDDAADPENTGGIRTEGPRIDVALEVTL